MVMKHRWKRNADGTYTIFGVELFAECERKGKAYDEKWMEDAVTLMRAREVDNYRPALHRVHTDKATGIPKISDEAEGYVGNTQKAKVRLAGAKNEVWGIVGDLLSVTADMFEKIQKKRITNRSVEVLVPNGPPEIDSVALLGATAPAHAFPQLDLEDFPVQWAKAYEAKDILHFQFGEDAMDLEALKAELEKLKQENALLRKQLEAAGQQAETFQKAQGEIASLREEFSKVTAKLAAVESEREEARKREAQIAEDRAIDDLKRDGRVFEEADARQAYKLLGAEQFQKLMVPNYRKAPTEAGSFGFGGEPERAKDGDIATGAEHFAPGGELHQFSKNPAQRAAALNASKEYDGLDAKVKPASRASFVRVALASENLLT